MTTAADTARRYSAWIALGTMPIIAGALVVGMGSTVALGLAGLAVAALFFLRPDFGLLLVAATIPIENAFVFSGITGTKIISAVALAGWVANRIVWKRDWGSLLISKFVLASVLFIAFAFASVLWAMEPRVSYRGAIILTQLFVWALMIADLARSPQVMMRLVRVLVASGSIAGYITVQQYLVGARRAGDQVAGGINATATILVTLVPLAFFLFRAERKFFWRLLGLIYVGLALAAVPVTLSRMNIMLLVAVVLLMSGLTLWGRRGRGWVFALGAAALVVGVSLVPLDRIGERARTIGPYLQSSIGQSADNPVSSGRGYHIRVGLAIARDHPILGVGYQNYGTYFLREYQFLVGGSEGLFYSRRSPHSSHVGILADLGLIGFLFWVALLSAGLYYALRAWWESNRRGLDNTRYLAQSVAVAVGLHALPFALYLPNQIEKILWLLLAMAFAVHHLARTADPPAPAGGHRIPGALGAPEALVATSGTNGRQLLIGPQPLGQGGYR